MRTWLTATVFTLSMAATATAAEVPRGATNVLAGGPVFTANQTYLYCEFINAGTTSIIPTAQELFVLGSTTPISSHNSCSNGTPVAPNQSCQIYNQSFLPSFALSCKITFSTAPKAVRGSLQLYDSNFNPTASVELR